MKPSWICCQIGAREHYAIPRALHHRNLLSCLYTDTWVKPGGVLSKIPISRLKQRFHPDLKDATVIDWSWKTIQNRALRQSGSDIWAETIRQNHWFAEKVRRSLGRLNFHTPPILFSFSYAARPLLEFAKERGWSTVLGQIDCGRAHENLVSNLNSRSGVESLQPPASYWDDWHAELNLADKIIVNSRWARDAILAEGVPGAKVHILPLAYSPPIGALDFSREYPTHFTRERPMNVLFLGGVSRAKGVMELLRATDLLQDDPVKFTIVGGTRMEIPEEYRRRESIHWAGSVSRDEVHQFFRSSDVFIFPTHSDGFGITQLEAQAWSLPVIASRMCGEVVSDGFNGIILDEVSPEEIGSTLRRCLANPCLLSAYSKSSVDWTSYSLETLGNSLENL